MSRSTPVDLVVATEMSRIAEQLAELPPMLTGPAQTNDPKFREATARELLCRVSHEAALRHVLAALAAVGAPASLDAISQRLQAARDVQRRETGKPATDTGR